jgi:cation transport ATPase
VDHRKPEPPTDVPAESAEPAGRRYPSTIGGACYLVLLAASAVGLWITSRGDWRLGVRWIAASLLAAAVLRLLLPARDAGMLAVRRRSLDVSLLAVVGVALFVLSVTIPNQPPL